MYRYLLTCLLGLMVVPSMWAQAPQPPAAFGARPGLTLSLSDPGLSSWSPPLVYDYGKLNPGFRSAAPRTRKCGTVEMGSLLQAQYAGEAESAMSFEQWMDSTLRTQQRSRGLFRLAQEEVYTIPVVVHIIHSNGLENISDEQVYSQMRVLNEDYRRQNPDQDRTPREFRNIATDTGIEFCLATVDPNGNPTNGIDRVSMSGSPFDQRYLNEHIKPLTIWDPERYLNIWVCNIAGGVLGFAQFPVSSGLQGIPNLPATALTDGIVINYNAFGTMGTAVAPFNRGRTTTHELGHWLGLRHIWGDGPCGVDDYCDDTPEIDDAHYACPPGATGCDGNPALVQNFMDYTDDVCMNMFTRDQRARMRAVLENSPRRRSLLTANTCGSAPPEPGFMADMQTGCAPLTVNFRDISRGEILTYNWFFPGGRPERATGPNPSVTYRQPGSYAVTLRVTNAGGSQTITQEGFIHVREGGRPLPFTADFEGESFPPAGMQVHNPQQDHTWTLSGLVSGRGMGGGSLILNQYDNNLKGALDWVLTPILDFSQETAPVLSFDLAYAPWDPRYSDTLGVFISTDCGESFRNIYLRGGSELGTTEALNRPFQPMENEWRTEAIDLREFAGASHVQIAFVSRNGYGNDLYLDNIHVGAARPAAPIADFRPSASSLCAGGTVTFADQSRMGPTQWIWAFPGGFPASDTTPNPQVRYATPGTYDVSLTVRNAGGTHSITRHTLIHVGEPPSLALTASRTTLCAGEPVTLEVVGEGEFTWELGPGIPAPSGRMVTLKPRQDALYAISGQSGSGCAVRSEVTVRVREARPLEVSPPVTTICAGSAVALTVTGADRYRWEPAEGLSHTQSGFVEASPRRTTTYTVTGTTQDGCVLTREVTVNVQQAPASFAVIAAKTTLCPGEQVVLQAEGALSYTWSGPALNRTQGATVTAAPEQTATYRVVAETAAGCRAEKALTLTVAESPRVLATASATQVCPGSPVTLSAAGSGRYSWSPRAELDRWEQAQVIARPTVDTRYVVTGRNAAGCQDTASVLVRVHPAPALEIVNPNPGICPGGSAMLTASGALTYEWFPATGLDRTQGPRVIARPNRDQAYTVRGTDANGCVAEAQTRLRVGGGAPPVASFQADRTLTCAGQGIRFESLSQQVTALRWEFPTGIPAVSTDPNPVVQFAEEGLHDVILTVRGCNGREDRQEALGYIVTTAPIRLGLNSRDATICRGTPYRLVASGAETYTWSPAVGLDRTEGAAVEAMPTTRTTYTVTGTDANGCEASRSVTLDLIGQGDRLSVTPFAPVICAGDAVTLRAQGGTTYTWFPQRGLDRFDGPEVTARPQATTTYTVEAVDLDGCIFRDTVTVQVRAPGELKILADRQAVCEGEQVTLKTSREGVFTWSPAYGLSSSTGTEIVANPRRTTTYQVRGTDAAGCAASGEITVTVNTGKGLTVEAQDAVVCTGEATLLTAEGGQSYRWSPAEGLDRTTGAVVTANPARTTTYTVTGEGAGCGLTQTVTVEVRAPAPLTISPEAPRICAGDQLPLAVSGGKAYVWDAAPGLNTVAGAQVVVRPTATTSYTVRAIDSAGCETSGSVTVQVAPSDFLTLAASAARVCAGDEVMLQAEGAQTYTWQEAPGLRVANTPRTYARPESTQVYRVAGENAAGCVDSATLRVEVRELAPAFEMSATRLDLARELGLVRFTDRTPGATRWLWDFGETSSSERQHPQHIFAEPGTYTVTLRVSDGVCTRQATQQIEVINSSSLEELADQGRIMVDAASLGGQFALELESPRKMLLRLRLMDNAGQELFASALRLDDQPYRQQIDLRNYPKGTYHLQLSDGVEVYTRALENR